MAHYRTEGMANHMPVHVPQIDLTFIADYEAAVMRNVVIDYDRSAEDVLGSDPPCRADPQLREIPHVVWSGGNSGKRTCDLVLTPIPPFSVQPLRQIREYAAQVGIKPCCPAELEPLHRIPMNPIVELGASLHAYTAIAACEDDAHLWHDHSLDRFACYWLGRMRRFMVASANIDRWDSACVAGTI